MSKTLIKQAEEYLDVRLEQVRNELLKELDNAFVEKPELPTTPFSVVRVGVLPYVLSPDDSLWHCLSSKYYDLRYSDVGFRDMWDRALSSQVEIIHQ